jgi:hypothetical protein
MSKVVQEAIDRYPKRDGGVEGLIERRVCGLWQARRGMDTTGPAAGCQSRRGNQAVATNWSLRISPFGSLEE